VATKVYAYVLDRLRLKYLTYTHLVLAPLEAYLSFILYPCRYHQALSQTISRENISLKN